MKLTKKQMLLISFMLFSLFFGAGNLIFPPFLGQNAGTNAPIAMLGFVITAVILPVLGVIVVAKADGLDKLAGRVDGTFAIVFTVLIYLSIGPGLGIPRAASVPFEMAVAPYLPEGASFRLFMLAYSFIFFAIACWLALTPKKLVERIGHYLTPSLLFLIVFLFINFVWRGVKGVAAPQAGLRPDYLTSPFLKGFCEGYQTMDTIAALNFGLVIATTLRGSMGLKEEKDVMKYTKIAGIFAGSILTLVYFMLTYMGTASSDVYPIQANGAWTLRCIVYQLFGGPGAILLAAIFTLACLTTCVGLITSISQYFSGLLKNVSYKTLVLGITGFSFVVCNRGLNTILSISMPVLTAVYPVSIILIILGLLHDHISHNKYIYPITVWSTAVVSVLLAIDGLKIPMGPLTTLCKALPFYNLSFGWVGVTLTAVIISLVLNKVKSSK